MKPVALACLAVLLLTACSDQQPLQPPAGSRPSALIMDGAHHGGNPDFFFLPTLAADPTGGPNFDAGKFNPNLAPTAEVCRRSGDPASGAVDCATDIQGQPVLVFGPKPMTLAVEQYQVTWDTKSPTLLDASKFYRIIVRGAPRGTMLGLLDVDPVTGGLKDVRTGEVVQFQDGRSLPIKVRIEQGAFGVTNPDHVEQVVTNHITTPTGTADVTTNTGFAGARLVDNWLPAAAVAAGIDRVVVIIERVPVNNAVPATSCLKSGFKELEGCYRFRTDPDLHLYGLFNATVIAGVCFEQPIHSDAPYEMFRREETGEQELVHLDDSDAPFLNCATFSPTPATVGVSPGARAGGLLGLARAGLHALMDRMGRALTPRPLHAVDLGAGGRTNAFSFFGWARRATMTKAAPSDNQVTLVGTKVLTDPTVCLTTLHPATRPLVGEPVTFTVSGGGGTVGGGASVPRVTGSDGCASAPWVLGSTTTPAGNRLTAAAAASPGTVEFVATGASVVVAAGGAHTCDLNASGQASCWGDNSFGELGDGTTSTRLVPTPVAGGLTFAALSAGGSHTCGVTASGAAYCWGLNNNGQLGDGTTTDRLVPTAVTGGRTFAAVSVGWFHACGVTTSGAAYCWGGGPLGDGTTTDRLVPTAVTGGLTFTALSAGGNHTCGVTTSGAAYCWGDNSFSELGDGTTTTRLVPTAVAFGTAPAIPIAGGTYNDRNAGVIGTGFLFDPTDPAGPIESMAIAGPAGWNGGAGLTIFRYQPPGMAPTRAVWWVFNPAIATSGTYTATATVGGVVRRATFSIDATSTMEAPQITSLDPGTSQVAMTWTASPSTQSFLVAVIAVPFPGFYAAARVVSGDTRALTFSGLSLVAGGSYQAVVWAYDKDVITPGAIGSQFNIGAHAVPFTAPSAILQ